MNKKCAIVLLINLLFAGFGDALVPVHKTHSLSPGTNSSINVIANGARYRFKVSIGIDHVDDGFVYATDGYKYKQSSIEWTVNIPGEEDVGVTDTESEESGNNYLKSLQWQTPVLNKSYTVKVEGERWPYGGDGGGGGEYDPHWESTSLGSITHPVIYDTALIKEGNKYKDGEEVAVEPSEGILVETKAGEGTGTPIQNSSVTVFWKLKDPAPINNGSGSLSVSSSTTDSTGLATVTLTCSSERGDDHIVTAQDKDTSPASSCDSGKAVVIGVEIDDEEEEDPEKSEEIQVQRVNTSSFIWEGIPFKIVYDIVPSSGWTADKVTLIILDSSDTAVYTNDGLSKSPGNNQEYEWNGKDDSGVLVSYGYYKAKIKVEKDEISTESDEYEFTVYQVNVGNTVYYDIDWPFVNNEHAGLIYTYLGNNTLSSLQDDNNYAICEIQGPGEVVEVSRTLKDFKDYPTPFRGIHTSLYLPSNVFTERYERAQIIQNANQLFGKPYISFPPLDVLIPYGDWDGIISDIQRIRCDGVTEVSYENAADRLFGDDVRWNIMISQDNLDYHNSECTPKDQRLSSQPRSLYSP